MSSWCTFRKGTRSEEIAIEELFPPDYSKKRLIQTNGWAPVQRSLSLDVDDLLTRLDDAIYSQMFDVYYDAAYHICLQFETFPQFPLIVVESIIDNRPVWIEGITKVLNCLTVKKTIFLTPTIRQTWKELVDEIRETESDAVLVLVLDERHIQQEYITKLFHLLKFFKRRISVIVNVIAAQIFGEACSFRTLKQFEPLTLRPLASEKLLDVIISSVTVNSNYVLQFSPYILKLIRRKFLLIDGSIETAKNIIKFSLINHTYDNVLWSYQSGADFSYLVDCYWMVAKHLSAQMSVPVFEMHIAMQGAVEHEEETDMRTSIRQWINSLSLNKITEFADFVLGLCEQNDKLALQYFQMNGSYSQLRKYRLRTRNTNVVSAVDETLVLVLSKYITKIIFSFMGSFMDFPSANYFVVTTDAAKYLFADPQLSMEQSLLNQDNDVNQCYKALKESGRWKRIAINEWANAFFKQIGQQDTPGNRRIFFASAATLENCGIVGCSSTTPKGFVDIYYQSRL